MNISSMFLICIQIGFAIYISLIEGLRFSFGFFVTNLMILIFSTFFLYDYPERPYSCYKLFYIFSYFFFGIAPALEFKDKIYYWGGGKLSENTYILVNIIIIIILIIFKGLYDVFSKMRNEAPLNYQLNQLCHRDEVVLLSVSATSFFIIMYYNNFSILNLLYRSPLEDLVQVSATSTLIVERFIRPISMICLIYYIFLRKPSKLVLFFLGLMAIAGSFPTGLPRFAVAALYIPLLIVTFPAMHKKNYFVSIIITGLMFIFPFLNQFRTFVYGQNYSLGLNLDMFTTENFDSYQNFVRVVDNDITTGGKQLLGVLLFFVPRTIWADKPIGSGAELAKQLGLYFSNISANYFAEGYLNFGYIGIFAFLTAISFTSARVDSIYWSTKNSTANLFSFLYILTLGMFFFMLRGDLMSSFAYTIGLFLSSLVVYFTLLVGRFFTFDK